MNLNWSDAWSNDDIKHNYLWCRDMLIVSRQLGTVDKSLQAKYAVLRAIMKRRGISTKVWSIM